MQHDRSGGLSANGLIDVHAHFLTDRYTQTAMDAGLARPDGMPGWPTWSADAHLSFMDRAGVAKSVLSISSPGVHFGDDAQARALAASVNDEATKLAAAHPGRFQFFATLPLPDVDGTLREIDRVQNAPGRVGFTVMSNAGGRYLGDMHFDPVWSVLHEMGAVVLVHPTSPPGAERLDLGRPRPMLEFLFDAARTASDLVFSATNRRHPAIQWLLTHGGGVLPLLASRMALLAQVVDATGIDVRGELARFWYDLAGTPLPDQLPALTAAFGNEHIVYGSDSCWTPPAAINAQLAALDRLPDGKQDWRRDTTLAAQRLLTGVVA